MACSDLTCSGGLPLLISAELELGGLPIFLYRQTQQIRQCSQITIHNQYARNGCTEYTEHDRQLNDEFILDQEKHKTIIDEAIEPPVKSFKKNKDGIAPTSWPTSKNLHLTKTQIT